MKHVELSGFGMNCKSYVTKLLTQGRPDRLAIMSDSEIIGDMFTRYWANFDPEERCRFRYHTLSLIYSTQGHRFNLIVDRGVVDQICFARMIDKRFIPKTEWIEEGFGEPNDNYAFIDDYIPYELKFPFERVFIKTLNRDLIKTVLEDEARNGIDQRSFFSKSVDHYLELQEKFYEEYKSIIPIHSLIEILDGQPIEDSIYKIFDFIDSLMDS